MGFARGLLRRVSLLGEFFFISFLLHALLSVVMFVYLRSVHDDVFSHFVFFTLSFLAYLNSLTLFPDDGGKRGWRYHLKFVEEQCQELSRYRKACYQLVRQRGIMGWRWYGVPWLGILGFLLSIMVFFWIGFPPVGLVVGTVFWCASLKWQTLREKRWCAGAGEIDVRFVHRRMGQFLLFYPIPLLLFYGWVHFSVVDGSKDYIAVVFIAYYSVSVFPSWLQLLLGQRTGFPEGFSLWKTPNSYGCFGKVDPHGLRAGRKTMPFTFLGLLPLVMISVVVLMAVKIVVHRLLL